jgi:hypothetical protein
MTWCGRRSGDRPSVHIEARAWRVLPLCIVRALLTGHELGKEPWLPGEFRKGALLDDAATGQHVNVVGRVRRRFHKAACSTAPAVVCWRSRAQPWASGNRVCPHAAARRAAPSCSTMRRSASGMAASTRIAAACGVSLPRSVTARLLSSTRSRSLPQPEGQQIEPVPGALGQGPVERIRLRRQRGCQTRPDRRARAVQGVQEHIADGRARQQRHRPMVFPGVGEERPTVTPPPVIVEPDTPQAEMRRPGDGLQGPVEWQGSQMVLQDARSLPALRRQCARP